MPHFGGRERKDRRQGRVPPRSDTPDHAAYWREHEGRHGRRALDLLESPDVGRLIRLLKIFEGCDSLLAIILDGEIVFLTRHFRILIHGGIERFEAIERLFGGFDYPLISCGAIDDTDSDPDDSLAA